MQSIQQCVSYSYRLYMEELRAHFLKTDLLSEQDLRTLEKDGTLAKGPRYLEMAEGYVTGIALDEAGEIIGYQFVNLGKLTDFIKKGDTPNDAWEKAKGQYGRVEDAAKIIDPRKE